MGIAVILQGRLHAQDKLAIQNGILCACTLASVCVCVCVCVLFVFVFCLCFVLIYLEGLLVCFDFHFLVCLFVLLVGEREKI